MCSRHSHSGATCLSLCNLPNDALREILIKIIPPSLKHNHGHVDTHFLSVASDILSFASSSSTLLNLTRIHFSSRFHTLNIGPLKSSIISSLSASFFLPLLMGPYLQTVHLAECAHAGRLLHSVAQHCPNVTSLTCYDGGGIKEETVERLGKLSLDFVSVDAPSRHTIYNLLLIPSLTVVELTNLGSEVGGYNGDNIFLDTLKCLVFGGNSVTKLRIGIAPCVSPSRENILAFCSFLRKLPLSINHLRLASTEQWKLHLIIQPMFIDQEYQKLERVYIDDYSDNRYVLVLSKTLSLPASSPSPHLGKRARRQGVVEVLSWKREVVVDDYVLGSSSWDMRSSFLRHHGYSERRWAERGEEFVDEQDGPDILRVSRADFAFMQGMRGRNSSGSCIRNIRLYAPNPKILRAWPESNSSTRRFVSLVSSTPKTATGINSNEKSSTQSASTATSLSNSNYLTPVFYNHQREDSFSFSSFVSSVQPADTLLGQEQQTQARHTVSYSRWLCFLFKSFPTLLVLHTTPSFIVTLSESPSALRALIRQVSTLHICSGNVSAHQLVCALINVMSFFQDGQTILVEKPIWISTYVDVKLLGELAEMCVELQREKSQIDIFSILELLNEINN